MFKTKATLKDNLVGAAIVIVIAVWWMVSDSEPEAPAWRTDFDSGVTRALVQEGIRGCGEYRWRLAGGSYYVECLVGDKVLDRHVIRP